MSTGLMSRSPASGEGCPIQAWMRRAKRLLEDYFLFLVFRFPDVAERFYEASMWRNGYRPPIAFPSNYLSFDLLHESRELTAPT